MARNSKNRLKELREKGVVLSQREAGLVVGLDVTTVSRHEGGHRPMTREQAIAYAQLYRVDTHELFVELPKEKG